MSPLRTFVKTCVYGIAWIAGIGAPVPKGVVILMYHSVSRGDWRWSIDPEDFERQMRFLSAHRTVVSLRDVLAYEKGEKQLPKDAVAITIDDGYKDTHDVVLPILTKYGIPATLFLTSDLTAKWTIIGCERPSWDEVRALAISGLMDIQVHGRGHVSAHALDATSVALREQFTGVQMISPNRRGYDRRL